MPVRTRFALAAGVAYLALYLAWLLWARPAETERNWVGGVAVIFTGLAAAWLALEARRRAARPDPARAWTWLAGGLALWVASDVLRVAGLPWADLAYLGGALALLFGLLRYPRRMRRTGRLRLVLDVTIAATALVCLVWLTILEPVSRAAAAGQAAPSAWLYPTADLVLLAALALLFLIHEAGSFPSAFVWMALGLAVYAISDLMYAYLVIGGAYSPAHPVNFGWALGDGLMLLSAAAQLQPGQASTRLSLAARRFQSLLPLVATLTLGGYAIFTWQFQGRLEPLALYGTVVLGLALITRQGILAGEVEFQTYASLVDSIAEPAFICDRRGRLQWANPALREVAGFADSLPPGLPIQQIFRPSASVQPALEAALHGRWDGEISLQTRSGGQTPVLLSLRPFGAGRDERLALAGTAHDLTEIKRQQDALRQAYDQVAAARAQLERLNLGLEQAVAEKTADLSAAYARLEQQNITLQALDRLKSDFVSLVSHELRAPLTNINGGIELVLSRSEGLTAYARSTLDLVQAEILRLTRFTETILDLSALDAGRTPVYPAPISLYTIEQALRQQMIHLPGAGRVEWQIPRDLPEFLADERALTSAVFHLLDNALKYAPDGPIRVTAGSEGGRGWISVADHGAGLSAEAMGMLFSPFFRSQADAQTVYGHGLGLYIVRRLMEAMNGTIEAGNRPQGGAVFTCRLPLVEVEESGEEDEPETAGGG